MHPLVIETNECNKDLFHMECFVIHIFRLQICIVQSKFIHNIFLLVDAPRPL